jgi:hypothetical protein
VAWAALPDLVVFILNRNRLRVKLQKVEGDALDPAWVAMPDHPAWLPNRPRFNHQKLQ